MTYNTFIDNFYNRILPNKHKDCRIGQSLMNYLADIWFKEYKRITGNSELDCFYNDSIINTTLNHLKNNWHNFYNEIDEIYYTINDEVEHDESFSYLTGERNIFCYYVNNNKIVNLLFFEITTSDNSEEHIKEKLFSLGFSKNICLVNL